MRGFYKGRGRYDGDKLDMNWMRPMGGVAHCVFERVDDNHFVTHEKMSLLDGHEMKATFHMARVVE